MAIFEKNMGTVDRAARAIVGLILIALTVVGPQTPWGWIGLIPLFTAVVGWCPAYVPLGFKTCKTQR